MFSGEAVFVSVQVDKSSVRLSLVSHIVPFELDQVWLEVKVEIRWLSVFSSQRRLFRRLGALSLFPSQFDVSPLAGCLKVA